MRLKLTLIDNKYKDKSPALVLEVKETHGETGNVVINKSEASLRTTHPKIWKEEIEELEIVGKTIAEETEMEFFIEEQLSATINPGG